MTAREGMTDNARAREILAAEVDKATGGDMRGILIRTLPEADLSWMQKAAIRAIEVALALAPPAAETFGNHSFGERQLGDRYVCAHCKMEVHAPSGNPDEIGTRCPYAPRAAEQGDAALVVEGGWRPIETAPRDGSEILVSFGLRGVHAVQWCEPSCSDYEIWCVDDGKHGPYALRRYNDEGPTAPTHWMPLPAPPEAFRPIQREEE